MYAWRARRVKRRAALLSLARASQSISVYLTRHMVSPHSTASAATSNAATNVAARTSFASPKRFNCLESVTNCSTQWCMNQQKVFF